MERYIILVRYDIRRCFFTVRYPAVILLAVLLFCFSAYEQYIWENSCILVIVDNVSYGIAYVFLLSILALNYGCVFQEDLQNKYIYPVLNRCTLRRYVLTKSVVIMAASVITLVAATYIFILILWGSGHPWFAQDIVDEGYYRLEMWKWEANGHHLIFYGTMAVQYGMLSGLMTLLSAYISLFTNNKMVVYAMPVICAYFLRNYMFSQDSYYNIFTIFNMFYNWKECGEHYLLKSCLITLAGIAILMLLIYRTIRKKVSNE